MTEFHVKHPWLLATMFLTGFIIPMQGQGLSLLWRHDPGSQSYLTSSGDAQRGMAYNPVSGNIIVVNRAGGLSVNVVDGATGAFIRWLDTSEVFGGTFDLNQIAIAEDGSVYAANLVTSNDTGAGALKIYRWMDDSVSAAPVCVWSNQVVNGTRWGDNLVVRIVDGSAQILMGQGGSSVGNRVAVIRPHLGITSAAAVMTVAGVAPGDTPPGAWRSGRTTRFMSRKQPLSHFDIAISICLRLQPR